MLVRLWVLEETFQSTGLTDLFEFVVGKRGTDDCAHSLPTAFDR